MVTSTQNAKGKDGQPPSLPDAVALATRLLAEAPACTSEFAGFLRHETARGRPLDVPTLAEPVDPMPGLRASWDRSAKLQAEFGGDFEAFAAFCGHDHRQGPCVPEAHATAPPVEVRVASVRGWDLPPAPPT